MTKSTPLAQCDIIAFVPIVQVEQAKRFYRDTLGLALVSEELPFALVFDANGTMVRLAVVHEPPETQGTVLGWQLPSIETAAQDLAGRGVLFERFPGLPQNEMGIWSSPSGAKVAWFKDPDANILSISQHPQTGRP